MVGAAQSWVTVQRSCLEALKISCTHFYRLRGEGKIRTLQLGARTLVPQREITRLIDEAPDRSTSCPTATRVLPKTNSHGASPTTTRGPGVRGTATRDNGQRHKLMRRTAYEPAIATTGRRES